MFYILNNKTTQFRGIVKSISLLGLFWFNLIIFTWIAGLSSYRGIWFIVHIFILFWISLGILFSILVIIFTSSRGIKSKFYTRFHRLPNVKFVYLLDKNEARFMIFVQILFGVSLSISDTSYPTRIHDLYFSLTPLIIIIFTIIAVDLLFLFSFILSSKKEDYILTKKQKEQFYLHRLKYVLSHTNRILSKKSQRTSMLSLDRIIKFLEDGIEYFKNSKNLQDESIIRQLSISLIGAYEKRGKMYDSNALRFYNKVRLFQAQKRWTLAIYDYEACLQLNASVNPNNSVNGLAERISEIRDLLRGHETEVKILEIEEKLKQVKKLERKDLTKAIELVNVVIATYSEIKEKTAEHEEFKNINKKLESKIQQAQVLRSSIQGKRDDDIGLKKIPAILKDGDQDSILSIIREYEFIGGQIRFKVAVINNTSFTFTNLRLAFDLPIALKWIMHEPNYERKGDSLLLTKLGAHEKQAVSLYLEPVNCMESSVNVTVSFFDAKEKPHAIPMKPKMIGISCPIFFTEDEANLARVKSLVRSLANRDKKVFPITDPTKANVIFSSIVSVLGKFDIKLVYKEYDDENNFGEAWFYGITKVKKQRIIPYVMLDGENKVLELEVSGDEAEQITAFLAEIGDRVRKRLILEKVIKPDEKFYDMRITVMSKFCPYCYTLISNDLVQKFLGGESIQCKNCLANINLDAR
jgi:tetratricopeptide (TPR) repeat protein